MSQRRNDIVSMGESYAEDAVVCPWCGYEHEDSWEFDDGETCCHDCEKTFHITVDTTITYSTRRQND